MQMVLLRHELPDRSWHFDWMIERGDRTALITFRVGERVDDPEVAEFSAERLADHRVAYLDYEGEVSGGRGWVKRTAAGRVSAVVDEGESVVVVGSFGGAESAWRGRRGPEGWLFRRGRPAATDRPV